MKPVFRVLLILLIAILGALPIVGPQLAERTQNSTYIQPPYAPSTIAKDLHQKLTVVDLHADSLLWKRDLMKTESYGHVDVPRLLRGNVALQAFTVVTKTPLGLNIERNSDKTDAITFLCMAQLWPFRTWTSLKERALYQAAKLHKYSETSSGKFSLILTASNLTAYLEHRKIEPDTTAGFLGLEGAHALEGNLKNVDAFYEAGFRMVAPTHFFDNELGGSAHGLVKGGLTPFGKQVIRRLEERHMIVDLAHASPRMIEDVLAIASRPVVVSHTGLKGGCNNIRNLSDAQAKAIATKGGLIGIGFWQTAVCGQNVQAITKSIRYATNLVGIEHVALGSDFDGAVTVPFDSSGMALLTEALIQEGFSDDEIGKIMGGNAIRFLSQNFPQ